MTVHLKTELWITLEFESVSSHLQIHTLAVGVLKIVGRVSPFFPLGLTCRARWFGSSISPVTNTWRINGSELRAT